MPRCRVVRPDTIRIHISDGDWLEVIARLNYGETTRLKSSVVKAIPDDSGRLMPDLEVIEIAQALAYLVDWSLVDGDGKRIPIDTDKRKREGLNQQDPKTVREIIDAISKHVEDSEQAQAQEKNEMATASVS